MTAALVEVPRALALVAENCRVPVDCDAYRDAAGVYRDVYAVPAWAADLLADVAAGVPGAAGVVAAAREAAKVLPPGEAREVALGAAAVLRLDGADAAVLFVAAVLGERLGTRL